MFLPVCIPKCLPFSKCYTEMKKHQQLVKVLYFKGYRVDSRRTPLSKFPGFQFLNCGRTRRTPFLILGIGLLKIRLLKKINHVVKGQFEFAIFFFFFFYFFFLLFFRLSFYSLLLVSWLALNIINYMHEMLRPTEDKFMTNHYPTFRDTGTYSFF